MQRQGGQPPLTQPLFAVTECTSLGAGGLRLPGLFSEEGPQSACPAVPRRGSQQQLHSQFTTTVSTLF